MGTSVSASIWNILEELTFCCHKVSIEFRLAIFRHLTLCKILELKFDAMFNKLFACGFKDLAFRSDL